MQIPISNAKWYDNLWAALAMFTSLPLCHIYQPPKESRLAAMEFWPLTGWVTATLTAMVLYFGSLALPYPVALLLAICTRLAITGATNEKGLYRFASTLANAESKRDRNANATKSRKTSCAGIIAMATYGAALFASLIAMPPFMATVTILAAEPFAKMVAGQLVMMMPHAQNASECPEETAFRHPTTKAAISMAAQGLLPMAAYIYMTRGQVDWQYVIFMPCVVMYGLYMLTWHKLRGYTTSCCSAVFLLVELAVYMTVAIAGIIYVQ